MRRLLNRLDAWLCVVALLLTLGVTLTAPRAQMVEGAVNAVHHASAGYVGPCDVSGVTCSQGWMIGALTNAYAAAAGNDFIGSRTSDSTTCTVKVNTLGAADLTGATNCTGPATFQSWATRATFTGATIATTTMTFTGSSGTSPSAGDQIIGVGLSADTTITGGCTGFGGSGTCPISPSQTVGSGETILAMIPVNVTQFYEQISGVNNQVTSQNYPFLWNCQNGLPCIQYATSGLLYQAPNNFTPTSGIVSFSVVAGRMTFASSGDVYIEENGANNFVESTGSANTWRLAAGGVNGGSFTVSDGSAHAVQVIANGSTSSCSTGNCANVDGTETAAGTAAGNTTAGKPLLLNNGATSTTRFIGAFFDDGHAWNSTVRAAECAKERSLFATPGSC